MTPRVLMTGGYGCIGSWAAKQLVEQNSRVWIYDLKKDTHRLDLLLDDQQSEQVEFLEGDVSDLASLRAAAERIEATHILHLAGLQVPTCRANPLLGAKVNVLGTLAVFETAVALKGQIQRVVYASSAAVHGPSDPNNQGSPIPDQVRLEPQTHYGAFKVCNENNAKVYWLDQGITSVGLRPWTVYGVGRDFGVTSEPTKAIKSVAAGRSYSISYGGIQDLQYVGDIAALFLKTLFDPFQGAEAYNVRGSVIPIEEFTRVLGELAPESLSLVSHGTRQLPIDPNLDDSRLSAAFGPLPQTSLKDGIQETLDRFRSLQAQGRLDLSDLG